jgi:DNA-binding transcriptional MocR family regulator
MSVAHREKLVQLARKYDCLVVSDDVYDLLQWPLGNEPPIAERPPEMRLPRLCDIDGSMDGQSSHGFGNAVSNGSFSKLAGPGVRTGWAEGTTKFANGLAHTASTLSGGCPSQLVAGSLGELVRTGELEHFLEETTRPSLQRRHKLMMDAIKEHIVPLGVDVRSSSLPGAGIYGGYFVWFTPREGLPSKLISQVAMAEENLIIGAGSMFEVHGDEKSVQFNTDIRLCFSWEAEEDVVEGVRRLGSVLKRMQENKAHYEDMAAKSGSGDFKSTFK